MGEMRNITLMKQQFVVTCTIRQKGFPALLDSWVTHTLCHNVVSTKKKKLLLLVFS